jgi:hypothetical protein
MTKNLPKIIKKHGFDFRWENQKVWELDIPIEEIDVSELEWIFDKPFWSETGSGYPEVAPRWVIDDMDLYEEHRKRIKQADISQAIDIMQNQLGEWLILDGLHRLVNLYMKGNKKIKVRKIPRKFIPVILKE